MNRLVEAQAPPAQGLGAALEAAFQAIPSGVVILDPDHRIAWCNSTAAIHLDLDPIRDRGQPLTNLVRAPSLVAALHPSASAQDLRIANHRPEQTLMLQVRPFAESYRLVLSHDVTESDRMELMRRDFVAHVSHEIRTPLTVLAGFVETMQTLSLDEAERDRVLELMRQQTVRMETLVADLLTLAQLEGSPKPPIDRWISLPALIRAAAADGHHLSAGRHQIVCADGPDLEVAVAEPELSSAVGNLVSNAIRYTPDGGRVEITWLHRQDGYVLIRVSDTGIGIERQHIPRLTQRFYRVDRSRSRGTGGTGLGLAIVKHAINRHGGELMIESTPGEGSRFTLTLPPARCRRPDAAPIERG